MAEIIGRQIEVGLAVEDTRGVAPASAETWFKNTTANIVEKAEHKEDDGVHGVLEDMDGRRLVKKWIEGDIEGIVLADPLGYLLYNIYGEVSSSLVGSGVYDHEFSLDQTIIHPSLSIFAKDGSVQQFAFKNGMIGTLELTATVDDYLRYTASFMAKNGEVDNSTPSYATDNYDFVGKEIVIKVADTEAGLVGATALKAKELTLTWETGLINDHILGAYEPDDIYNAKMAISGKITKNFDDLTFKNLFLSNNYKYMSITITGEASIGTTYHPTITLILNRVGITSWDRSGGADELVVEEIEFKAYYNATDAEQSTLTLRNLTAEYDIAPSA